MTQTAKPTAPDRAAGDNLGWSVAVSGDTVVAGAADARIGSKTYEDNASGRVIDKSGHSDTLAVGVEV